MALRFLLSYSPVHLCTHYIPTKTIPSTSVGNIASSTRESQYKQVSDPNGHPEENWQGPLSRTRLTNGDTAEIMESLFTPMRTTCTRRSDHTPGRSIFVASSLFSLSSFKVSICRILISRSPHANHRPCGEACQNACQAFQHRLILR